MLLEEMCIRDSLHIAYHDEWLVEITQCQAQLFVEIRNMKEKEPIQAALPYVLNIQ